jgi:hypothetical protein
VKRVGGVFIVLNENAVRFDTKSSLADAKANLEKLVPVFYRIS